MNIFGLTILPRRQYDKERLTAEYAQARLEVAEKRLGQPITEEDVLEDKMKKDE